MQEFCPYCAGLIPSKQSNFCSDCSHQLRELSPEDAAMVAPEIERQKPIPVVVKIAPKRHKVKGKWYADYFKS